MIALNKLLGRLTTAFLPLTCCLLTLLLVVVAGAVTSGIYNQRAQQTANDNAVLAAALDLQVTEITRGYATAQHKWARNILHVVAASSLKQRPSPASWFAGLLRHSAMSLQLQGVATFYSGDRTHNLILDVTGRPTALFGWLAQGYQGGHLQWLESLTLESFPGHDARLSLTLRVPENSLPLYQLELLSQEAGWREVGAIHGQAGQQRIFVHPDGRSEIVSVARVNVTAESGSDSDQ